MSKSELIAHTCLVEAFDVYLYATKDGAGLEALQNRFAMWLRGLTNPVRFITWQIPADLRPRIQVVAQHANATRDARRRRLLMEYRRHYEQLQQEAQYQKSVCGICMWTEPSENSQTIVRNLAGAFDVPVWSSPFPPLFEGRYALSTPHKDFPYWHLRPVGKPGGRSYFALLSSYEFFPIHWNFFRPLPNILQLPYAMAIAVDLPTTYERNQAISALENMVVASKVHLATSSGEDSKSLKKLSDCHIALHEMNEGDMLHEAQIVIAVAASDRAGLKKAVDDVISVTKPYFLLRPEAGQNQVEAAKFFGTTPADKIQTPQTTWQMVSREAALTFTPLGFRKLTGLAGTLRGQSADGSYPFFFNSWTQEKRATHEVWVGETGAGKTFALNLNLSRQYIEEGVPFDLLEPMGHGKIIADALDLPYIVPSPQSTCLNPLDVMYPDLTEQVTHVIRLVETMLGRTFSGNQLGNHQKALLGQSVVQLYDKHGGMDAIRAKTAPIIDDLVTMLAAMGTKRHVQQIARDLADEIAGLCAGAGPYSRFVNARTNIDLSYRGSNTPRVFSFHEMASDPELLALAYTQVLSAIRRDSLADECPRVIAVDEVYRLMRHPSLLDFLIEAVKTFRTRRKKVCVVDQQMSLFLDTNSKARLIFENCPIRVIFNQRGGMHVFKEDPAFSHFSPQHLEIIASLKRGFYVLDIANSGIHFLFARASSAELERFGST
jgi:hypothetical protein